MLEKGSERCELAAHFLPRLPVPEITPRLRSEQALGVEQPRQDGGASCPEWFVRYMPVLIPPRSRVRVVLLGGAAQNGQVGVAQPRRVGAAGLVGMGRGHP